MIDGVKSKKMINELCASPEFNDLMISLKDMDKSIEGQDVEGLMESIASIGRARDGVFVKMNSMLKYTIDKYLTEAQIQSIDMESGEKGINISYKGFIPSYINPNNIYTSIDTSLFNVDFKNKSIYVYDVGSKFDIAEKCKKEELKNEATRIEILRLKIREMEEKRNSQAFVINKVNQYNKDAIVNKTFEKIKCKLSKNLYSEYLVAYDDILEEEIENYNVISQDFKKRKGYSYVGKKNEVTDLQKGILRRLTALNFNVKYENEKDRLEVAKRPINIGKIYNV